MGETAEDRPTRRAARDARREDGRGQPRRLARHAAALALGAALLVPVATGPTGAGGATLSPRATSITFPAPNWTDTIGPVALSSPTYATLQGVPAIVFGSESGYVYAVDARTGQNLPGWPVEISIAPGVPTAVESGPTVAYLDGPGHEPTIIVGAGSTYIANQQGGLVALRSDGTVRFQFNTEDIFHEWSGGASPDGYREAVFSTPAVGDITGDRKPEIVFGSWDHHLYALNRNGELVKGFPIDTQDTIWSSPALYHVRGKHGQQDIFVGGDASGRDGCYGGFIYDIAYSHHAPRIVWQHCKNQTIWSSPAVGAIGTSGRPVVVVGTGFGETPPYKSDSYKLFAYYAKSGRRVPGWPVTTTGPTFGSPAIGTLPGSQTPAIVDVSWCMSCGGVAPQGASTVYAWSGSGQVLWTQQLAGANAFSSPVLADLTGSGVNDVLIGSSAGLYALDGGSGAYLFGTSLLTTINTCSVQNSLAVADVPDTGWQIFEACGGPQQVTAIGRLINYPFPAIPAVEPPWPMWRSDAQHDGIAAASFPVAALARRTAQARRAETRRKARRAATLRRPGGQGARTGRSPGR